jgi:hypothetical protein
VEVTRVKNNVGMNVAEKCSMGLRVQTHYTAFPFNDAPCIIEYRHRKANKFSCTGNNYSTERPRNRLPRERRGIDTYIGSHQTSRQSHTDKRRDFSGVPTSGKTSR